MNANQASKEMWKKMRDKPLKERIAYFWTYYKWPTIAIAIVIVVASIYLGGILSQAETRMGGILLNSTHYWNREQNDALTEEIKVEFLQRMALTEKQLEISLDNSRTYNSTGTDISSSQDTAQIVTAYVAAEMLDFIVGDEAALMDFAYGGCFQNMEEHLSAEMLEQYADDLLYVDLAVIRRQADPLENACEEYPDPRKPEKMEEPVPVLVCVNRSSKIQKLYEGQQTNVYFGFSSKDPYGYAAKFWDYLLEAE